MIESIIFDWGGVLAPLDTEIAVIVLKEQFEFDKIAFVEYFNQHEDDFCHTTEYEEFLSIASKTFNIPVEAIIDALNTDPPYNNLEIAEKLSENYDIYVLSNQLRFKSDHIRLRFNLGYFKEMYFSNEVGLKKPSPEIFDYLLQEINQDPENCLFIDDCPDNIAVAKQLRFYVILYENLEQFKKELASYSIYID